MGDLTSRRIKAWIREEEKSAREYERYGFTTLAEDERRHARLLRNYLNK